MTGQAIEIQRHEIAAGARRQFLLCSHADHAAWQREAMYEIYSFCRVVDDIADDAAEEGRAPAKARRVAAEYRRDLPR